MKLCFKRHRRYSAANRADSAPRRKNELTSVKRELAFLLWVRGAMVFLLFLMLCGTGYAWISITRTARTDELGIKSDTAEIFISGFNVYRCVWDDENLEYTYLDITDEEFTLNGYDALFGRNDNTPAFVRLKLDGVNVEAGTRINFALTRANTSPEPNGAATNTNGLWESASTRAADYLSNIIDIKAAQITSLYGENDPRVVYSTASAYNSWSSASAFVTTQKDAQNKTRYASKNAVTGTVGLTLAQANTIEIFLKIDYNPEFVMAYLNSRGGSQQAARLDKYLSYDFTGDISSISVEIAEGA